MNTTYLPETFMNNIDVKITDSLDLSLYEGTVHHLERVSQICLKIAQVLALSEDEKLLLVLGGLFHDIGKNDPEIKGIVSSPRKITEKEYEKIKRHPERGFDYYKILKNNSLSDLDHKICRIILEHHERYNGKGYPNGLKGDQIFIYAQYLSVADVIDAVSTRVYNLVDHITPKIKLERIFEEERGKFYSNEISNLGLKLIREESVFLSSLYKNFK